MTDIVKEMLPRIERASTASLRNGLQEMRKTLRNYRLAPSKQLEADAVIALLQSEISRRAD